MIELEAVVIKALLVQPLAHRTRLGSNNRTRFIEAAVFLGGVRSARQVQQQGEHGCIGGQSLPGRCCSQCSFLNSARRQEPVTTGSALHLMGDRLV